MPDEHLSNPSPKSSRYYFPPDMAALLGVVYIILPIAIFTSWFATHLSRLKSRGDATLVWFAFVLAAIGAALLFAARLPLYKQRRFFVIGPGDLDEKHRRIYRLAYRFIGVSVGLLILVLSLLQ
jgi:hypothetical protein